MHKNALGWTIADIKGISPLICTHRIYLEENAKPSREMQRRLNPNMKEVVKNEVLNEVKNFYWDDPYLFKYCPDQIFQRCIPDNEVSSVIKFCHFEACGSHFSSRKTTAKILQSGFYWPTV